MRRLSRITGIFLILIATVISIIYGYFPNLLLLIYVIIATYCFMIAFTRFTSAITTVVPDFSNLLGIIMQIFFWFTPVIWNLDMLAEHVILARAMRCIPFTYLITAFRQVFINENIIFKGYGIYTLIFWIITVVLFVWGNSVFKRTKKDFADVL